MAFENESAFQVLSFIAAPALLTNASSVLILSTSNRFARAVDRARLLSAKPLGSAADRRALERVTVRAHSLNRALIAFYVASAAFALGTFSELLGGGIAALSQTRVAPAITTAGLVIAAVGTAAIAVGAASLVMETWSAYRGLREEAALVLEP